MDLINRDSYSSINTAWEENKNIEKMMENIFKEKYENRLLKAEKTVEEHEILIKTQKETIDHKIMSSENCMKKEILNLENTLRKNIVAINSNNEEIYNQLSRQKACNVDLVGKIDRIKEDHENLKKNKEEEWKCKIDLICSEFNFKVEMFSKLVSSFEKLSLVSEIRRFKDKKSDVLDGPNDSNKELDFREKCLWYEKFLKDSSQLNPELNNAYKDYVNAYHKNTSLYLTQEFGCKTELIVYDIENSTIEKRLLDIAETLNQDTCIAQLPGGKLFCCGKWEPISDISLIINNDCSLEMIPSEKQISNTSAIYVDGSVYCFGGFNINGNYSTWSKRFDLDENCWNNITPLPQVDSYCACVEFDRKILIAGFLNQNLLWYSIDNDNYKIISSFTFAEEKRKILIKAERLYLIECKGNIYEI